METRSPRGRGKKKVTKLACGKPSKTKEKKSTFFSFLLLLVQLLTEYSTKVHQLLREKIYAGFSYLIDICLLPVLGWGNTAGETTNHLLPSATRSKSKT